MTCTERFYFWRKNRCADRQHLPLQEQLNLASVYGDNSQIVSRRAQGPLLFFNFFSLFLFSNKINTGHSLAKGIGARKEALHLHKTCPEIYQIKSKVKRNSYGVVMNGDIAQWSGFSFCPIQGSMTLFFELSIQSFGYFVFALILVFLLLLTY